MSTNFLQRFKGKTQQLGKDGLIDVVRQAGGSGSTPVIVKTNIDLKARQTEIQIPQHKIARQGSNQILDEPKAQQRKAINQLPSNKPPKPKNKQPQPVQSSPPPQLNPFYIANPFRMDDDQPDVPFQLPKQKSTATPSQNQNQSLEKQPSTKQTQQQFKQTSKSYASRGLSCDAKKTNNKQWVKLGGLGANIGGQEWQERKKKLDKMQEFAEQVKVANAEKVSKEKKLVETDEEAKKKEKENPRTKALEYSKNIPKPPKKPPKKEEQIAMEPASHQILNNPAAQQHLRELQFYQQQHKQLSKLLNQK